MLPRLPRPLYSVPVQSSCQSGQVFSTCYGTSGSYPLSINSLVLGTVAVYVFEDVQAEIFQIVSLDCCKLLLTLIVGADLFLSLS